MRQILLNLKEIQPTLLAPVPADVDLNHRQLAPFQTPAWMRRFLGFNASVLGCYGRPVYWRARRLLADLEIAAVQCEHLWSFPLSLRLARSLRVPLLLVEHNIETIYVERVYRTPLLAKLLSVYERQAIARSDRVVVCSKIDADLLQQRLGVMPEKIWIVPNGVNLPASSNGKVDGFIPAPLRDKKLILFVGKTTYPPNAEAIGIIRNELAPQVHRHDPNIVFVIAGGPHEPDYSKIQNGLAFTGFIENLEPLLKRASVCIAPLASGSGTRLKILEYAAYAKPIVSTSVAIEGLPLIDQNEVLIADDWNKFANAIFSILQATANGEALGQRAYLRVAKEYQWKSIAANFEQKLLQLIGSTTGQRKVAANKKQKSYEFQNHE
jgi:glycosyltransferase involved in cell wall biosynthesis